MSGPNFTRRLRKYVTLDYLHKLLAKASGIEVASRDGAGLMSAEQARKLEDIEPRAAARMTPAEVLAAVQEATGGPDAGGIDATTVGGLRPGELSRAGHFHDERYPTHDELGRVLTPFVTRGELSHRWVMAILNEQPGAVDAGRLGGHGSGEYLLRSEMTPNAVAMLLAHDQRTVEVDADTFGKMTPEQWAEQVEPRNPELVAADKPVVWKAGHAWEAKTTSGIGLQGKRYTPMLSASKLFRYAAVGDHAFVAPETAADYEVTVIMVAGERVRVSFEGFTSVDFAGVSATEAVVAKGEALQLRLTKIKPYVTLEVKRLPALTK